MTQLSRTGLSEQAENMIKELNTMHGQTKDAISKLIEVLRHDKIKDEEISKILLERVKFISRSSIYEYMPKELKREYTKPLPKTINVTTEHKVINVEPKEQSDHDWHYEQGEKEEEAMEKAEQEKEGVYFNDKKVTDEEPTPLELAEIKIKHLEEALHKTEQFKPATAMQPPDMTIAPIPKVEDEKEIFEWLRMRNDGTGKFWYDTYGIDLFKNRELAQLKNSGVKTFKRLYFEV